MCLQEWNGLDDLWGTYPCGKTHIYSFVCNRPNLYEYHQYGEFIGVQAQYTSIFFAKYHFIVLANLVKWMYYRCYTKRFTTMLMITVVKLQLEKLVEEAFVSSSRSRFFSGGRVPIHITKFLKEI